ncbi:sugar-binding protein, partial [Streptomyces sp. NPDC048577]
MSREKDNAQVELPDLPEASEAEGDNTADKRLTLAEEVPIDPYDPKATTPWVGDVGTATLPVDAKPGDTVPLDKNLPIAIGVPEGTEPEDAAALAGEWTVGLAAPEASQDAGVSGLIMKVTPPATVDPAAQVSLSVDTTGFADLYGPQAADRFGLVLLPDCVYDDPTAGECADDGGTTTMAGEKDPESFERLSSSVEVVPAKDAPTRTTAAKGAKSRKVTTGTVPVAKLLADTTETAGTATGASARTASLRTASGSSGGSAVGLLDTGSSVQGDFTASPLLSAGSWSAGASSGAF